MKGKRTPAGDWDVMWINRERKHHQRTAIPYEHAMEQRDWCNRLGYPFVAVTRTGRLWNY